MSYLLRGKKSIQLDQFVLSSCDVNSYPSLFFRLNDTWFEVKPNSFILNATYTTTDDYTTYCTVGIIPQQSSLVILGAPFMKNYYMIFDLD